MKRIISVSIMFFMIFAGITWFLHEKHDIEHIECVGKTNEYTFTKKNQIEEILSQNRDTIEKLVLNMREYSGTYSVVLSKLDEYVKQKDDFVISNIELLSEFYKNSKMDYIIFLGDDNSCQIYQEIPPTKAVSLKLYGKIDSDNNFVWTIQNTSSDRFFSVRIYNLLYNRGI